MGPLFNLPRSATARAGNKGAKLTGYTLRQYSDIVGLDTLGDVLGKAGRAKATAKKATAKKAAPRKRAAPVKKQSVAATAARRPPRRPS
jgi:hypothetical protein